MGSAMIRPRELPESESAKGHDVPGPGPRPPSSPKKASRRWAPIVVGTCTWLGACSSTKVSEAPEMVPSVEVGARHYARTCALCHGERGEGYVADNATALNGATFLASASDDFLRRSIARGRPSTTMSAWSSTLGGPYGDADIASIVAFMRTWQTSPSVTLTPSTLVGDIASGESLYAAKCESCHGAAGKGGPNVRLANPEFLAIASDAFLAYAIAKGRAPTPMRAYEGELTEQQIADVVALIRSWAKPVLTGAVPLPGSLGPVILHEGGPEPNFVIGQRFTPADTIKAELDRGAAMGFLDARAPSDYVEGHIAGANDVPFYDATKYVTLLPKDRWLVSYCGCPHAESGKLADTLYEHGFTKVTILDEGFFVWSDRGYPVRTGVDP
ncbi:MAG: c-type cytochrome [Polyangiaceae bacterium]